VGAQPELERELLTRLTEAGLPLAAQVALGAGLVVGYWAWSRAYYRLLDPALRGVVGRMLGAPVAWVLRHDASYETPPWRSSRCCS
jgi:hypothetical protein